MQDLIVNLLSPILGPMGVSSADLATYVGLCINYIYAILIALVIAIVVIVVASIKAPKGKKLPINVSACVAWVLVVLIVANLVCFGPLHDNVAMFLNSTATLSQEAIDQSMATIQTVGEEGMVLVKNDGLLPLSSDVTSLNVFGWDSAYPVYGGSGSGSADTSASLGILDSFHEAGYTTNDTLTQMYRDYQDGRTGGATQISYTDWTLYEPTVDHYTDEIMTEAKDFSDVAVIAIGRPSGEGQDEPIDMYAVIHGTYNNAEAIGATDSYSDRASSYTNNGDYDDFDQGEHYLQLSNTEEALIEKVCSEFDKVIVVINANNAMELGWVNDYPQIGAVILAPGTGASGMLGLGEIVKGTVNPSGKTVDTYVYDLFDTPTANNFGQFIYTGSNADDIKAANLEDGAFNGLVSFVDYVENIYVGYKFYETAAEEGLFAFEDKVQYPFGYGLSYTTFSQEIQNFDASGDSVNFDVVVTNTGSVAGKDVVEVYYTPPYTNGGIEKASVNLIQFGKTNTLEAGASQTISFSIPKEDMASYDSEGIKVSGGGYILEAGDYTISIRSDSHTVLDSETFNVSADQTGRTSDLTPAVNLFDDEMKNDTITYLSRADGFANYDAATAAPSDDAYVLGDAQADAIKLLNNGFYDPTVFDDPNAVMPTTGANNGMKLYQLTGADYDDARWDTLLDQLSVDDMVTLVNIGGWQTAAIDSVGKVATSDCDGPAGVNNFVSQKYGTAYPSEVLMAQTWNTELAARIGDAMGREYEEFDNFGWYGPAMDTHRSAFNGRNFEYYSEDGVLAGWFASAQVNAAAEHGVYAYIKHYVLNEQETDRNALLNTFTTEQALREIYMKPFEIVVKNFDFAGHKPLAFMTSFNFIGNTPAIACSDSLNGVLRNEWGFVGMVMSDYNGSYGYQNTDAAIRNGNDLMLGFARAASNQITDTSAASCVQALRQASKNILYTVANSGYYADGDPTGGIDNMTRTFIIIDVIVAAIAIAIEAIAIVVTVKKAKKKAA